MVCQSVRSIRMGAQQVIIIYKTNNNTRRSVLLFIEDLKKCNVCSSFCKILKLPSVTSFRLVSDDILKLCYTLLYMDMDLVLRYEQ